MFDRKMSFARPWESTKEDCRSEVATIVFVRMMYHSLIGNDTDAHVWEIELARIAIRFRTASLN